MGTLVRIRAQVDAVGGASTASAIDIRLVGADGRELRGVRTTDGAPLTTLYRATLAAGSVPLVLDLVPQAQIALADAAPTYYRVRRSSAGVPASDDLIQVPVSGATQELADLIGASAIDPTDIVAGRFLPATAFSGLSQLAVVAEYPADPDPDTAYFVVGETPAMPVIRLSPESEIQIEFVAAVLALPLTPDASTLYYLLEP